MNDPDTLQRDATAPLRWVVDHEDRILEVDGPWDEFARANDGERAVGTDVIGTRWGEHVVDVETRQLLTELYERVRRTGHSVEVPFRCDAPELARWLVLCIVPLGEGRLEITSRTERVEPRRAIPALDSTIEHDPARMIRCCSWCKDVWVEGDGWQPLERAAASIGLFLHRPPELTHGVCPRCVEMMSCA